MPRDLILGTAGHIDHGKTSLVKALTGIDCDRLPEEKERGITIDIGFAWLDLGAFHLGIVDVPGHERFIKNMLAGATGIDLALLVIAADDSIMPQTREHLEILKLLGLRHGVIAITKADLVDETTIQLVMLEVRDFVRDTFLAEAPIIATSATSGLGIVELKAAIRDACEKVQQRQGSEWFRLPIDRAFVVQGHGTVVTGSVTSGSLRVGEEVEWLPRQQRVRIRSLQNHDRSMDEVHRGQRAALNLAGVSHEEVVRGQELATPGFLLPSRCLTVRLRNLPETRRPLKHRLEVRLHLGTAETMATVSFLDCDELKPGDWALAQLFTREAVVATWGQPFVVRESSATHTLGGGQVLQPIARKIRRRHVEMLEWIEKLWQDSPRERALCVAWLAGTTGVAVPELVRGAGIGPVEAEALLADLVRAGDLIDLAIGSGRSRLLHRRIVEDLEHQLLAVLQAMHQANPLMTTHDRQKVQAQLAHVGDENLVQAVTDRLIAQRKVVSEGRRIARADFKPKLSAALRKLKDRVVHAYREARFSPPEPSSFANQAGGNANQLADLFDVCVAEGHLVAIAPNLYLHAEVESEMRRLLAEQLHRSEKGMTVAEIRDLLGTTRKFAVPFCEYLDRIGLTRREGDFRFLNTQSPAPMS
jgi:selenocysteine-specific elongation factor